jgi:alkylated DNA repair dioxygenase AlkB
MSIKARKIKETTYDLGSGDSIYIKDFMGEEEAHIAFNTYMYQHEVEWVQPTIKGSNVSRKIAVQGDATINGTVPVYRHPLDEYIPSKGWSNTTNDIRIAAEKKTDTKLNHVMIQLYEGGRSYISDHSDKTLDIKIGTSIVCVNLGQERLLVLKKKCYSHVQEITLHPGSLYVIGWKTNIEWTHGIRRMGDPNIPCSPRVSLTFRTIATFLRKDGRMFGQGAIHKTEEELNAHIDEESRWMQRAFGDMNTSNDVDDPTFIYPRGFDIINPSKYITNKEFEAIENAKVKKMPEYESESESE